MSDKISSRLVRNNLYLIYKIPFQRIKIVYNQTFERKFWLLRSTSVMCRTTFSCFKSKYNEDGGVGRNLSLRAQK